MLITGGLTGQHQNRGVRALARDRQNLKPRYQIAARSMTRRITSRRGDQPAFLSIQFFFLSRRMRISDMAFLVAGGMSHRDRSGGDPTLAGANEGQQVPDLRDLVHLFLSEVQSPR